MNYRQRISDKKRIVFKIGTSTLTHENGQLNFQRIDRLVMVLSDLRNQGREVLLVSSGAIATGAIQVGLREKPRDLAQKQALAAIGQASLMRMYQKMFATYNQTIAQILITKDIVTVPIRQQNAQNTMLKLLEMGVIPVINENDTVATDEIEFGDNDTLSAYVASIAHADLLVLLSDINGLYSANPRTNPDATIIPLVEKINDDIEKVASGSGSTFGTGGMTTKIAAARIAAQSGIDTVIMHGGNPSDIFTLMSGREIGTLFLA